MALSTKQQDEGTDEMYELLKRKLRGNMDLCTTFNHYFGSIDGLKHNIDSGNHARAIENLLDIVYDLSEKENKRPPRIDVS